MNPFEDQRTFMHACSQTTELQNISQIDLDSDLITEEFNEWWDSKPGSADDADACIDMIVVIIGYMYSNGWPVAQLWEEVMRSNMAKIGPDGFVRRRDDGKVLKPEDWTPPDLERVIREAAKS